MSLADFQRALSDLIASPELCLKARSDPERHLARYDLSTRERRRLAVVVWQRGMSTSCTLYRINRITPLHTLLPLTCQILGNRLIGEAERFWRAWGDGYAEFNPEVERFAAFLLARLAAGELVDPYIAEILRFELAVNALHFLPRRKLQQRSAPRTEAARRRVAPNPLVRLVRFEHEPLPLLTALAARQPVAESLAVGEFFVILDATGEQLELRLIDRVVAQWLQELEMSGPLPIDRSDVLAALHDAGLLVSA